MREGGEAPPLLLRCGRDVVIGGSELKRAASQAAMLRPHGLLKVQIRRACVLREKNMLKYKDSPAALTDAVSETVVEMLDEARAHLADLVLAWLFVELLLQAVLGAVNLQQQLLQFAQLILQRFGAGGGGCIQVFQRERRES